jgi:hypothetical protein
LQPAKPFRIREARLVSEVITGSGETIKRNQPGSRRSGDKPGPHGEVLVVFSAMKSLAEVS